MATIIKRNLFYVNGFTNFQSVIIELCKKKYTKIYVSIGSKWNESTYEYSQMYGNKEKRQTNSHLQMVPNFMKDRHEKVILIVLDQFNDLENRTTNFGIIQKQLNEDIDFIFYDDIDNIGVIQTFIKYMVDIVEINDLSPDNFMIANFIKFQHPNIIEYSTEKSSPDVIDKILKSTIYSECLYVWFGYQENLYNMLYKYSRYKNMFRFTEIICTLNTLLRSDILGIENISYINDHYKSQKNHLYFDVFLKNVVDISTFYRDENKICCSLMECLEMP